MNVKDWVEGIGKADPFSESTFIIRPKHRRFHGWFWHHLKKMYNSEHRAPLFEFRDLDSKETRQIESFMKDADSAVQEFHKDFADAPTK